MTYPLLCFVSTYVAVFALGLQSLNVNQGHYWAAAGTSVLIGLGHIALYKFMPGASLAEVAGYLAGGITGITSSMWFHRSFKKWWSAWRARRAAHGSGQVPRYPMPLQPPPPRSARPPFNAPPPPSDTH